MHWVCQKLLNCRYSYGQLSIILQIATILPGPASLIVHPYLLSHKICKECHTFAFVLQSLSATRFAANAIPESNKSVMSTTAPCSFIDFDNPLNSRGIGGLCSQLDVFLLHHCLSLCFQGLFLSPLFSSRCNSFWKIQCISLFCYCLCQQEKCGLTCC